MKIVYKNKFLDIYLFNVVHQFKSAVVQIFYVLMAVAIMLIEFKYTPSNILKPIFTGFIFYIVIWAVQLVFNLFYLYSKKDKAILTQHTIEIQNDALFEETKYNQSFFYWKGINKIVQIPGFIAVYVTKHMAHIIPNRAFTSETERNNFINSLKKKVMPS